MKLFVALFALVAVAAAQVSNEYLPPNYGGDVDASGIAYASAPAPSYESYETAAAAPSHSYSDAEGYRYKTQRRRVVKTARRHRREVSTEYLPPAASAPSNAYLAPDASYNVEAFAPAASYESYETAAAAPSHSYSDAEGYRYKTQRRRVVKTARRHRREVSAEYLPPAASAPSNAYLAPAASAPSTAYLAPAASYNAEAFAPAASYESYDTAAAAPSHSYSDAEGYRYKTQRRRVVKTARRHRREVSTEYLPPAASAPSNAYLAPAASYNVEALAPAASYESYETAAAAPSHSYSDAEGYRYKTQRRRVVKTARRHRREVSAEYLPPAASAPSNAYLAPAASYNVEAFAPEASYESYETAAAAPSHSYSDAEGYRYKTQRRRVVKTARRHRRDVSTEYLPPAASAPAATYAEPAASYSSASYSTPAGSYSVEASAPGGVQESYETAAAAPAHSFSDADGYRYKTARRRVIRRRRF